MVVELNGFFNTGIECVQDNRLLCVADISCADSWIAHTASRFPCALPAIWRARSIAVDLGENGALLMAQATLPDWNSLGYASMVPSMHVTDWPPTRTPPAASIAIAIFPALPTMAPCELM